MSLAMDMLILKWLQNTRPWRGMQEKLERREEDCERGQTDEVFTKTELSSDGAWEKKKGGIDSGLDMPTFRERSYIF